jgi:hypothetical protein
LRVRDNVIIFGQPAEQDRIFTRAHNRTAFYRSQGMDSLAAAQRAGTELGSEIRTAAAIERRSEAMNLLATRSRLTRRRWPQWTA